jgi:peroxiredoxin
MYDSDQPKNILPPGTKAPDFTLPSSEDRNISLSEYRGRPVVLVFYPADWSPVCTDQLSLYNQILPEFNKHNAQILGISVDSVWSHKAWAKTKNLHFPLLADFEPKGHVSKMYGAYMYREGMSARALFVIDPKGIIAWSYLSPSNINPGADGILEALESLDKKKVPA